jgi:hypothetical protein
LEIWTDYKNLEYFQTAWKLNQRQAQWSLFLSRFDFSLHHHPERTMGKPDALSQHPDHRDSNGDNTDLVLLKPELFTIRALEGVAFERAEQDVLKEIQTWNQKQAWEDSVVIMVKALKDTKANMVQSVEWKLQDGLICHRDLLYVPNNPELQWRIVEQHHDS